MLGVNRLLGALRLAELHTGALFTRESSQLRSSGYDNSRVLALSQLPSSGFILLGVVWGLAVHFELGGDGDCTCSEIHNK